jgi:hypothetical protein
MAPKRKIRLQSQEHSVVMETIVAQRTEAARKLRDLRADLKKDC